MAIRTILTKGDPALNKMCAKLTKEGMNWLIGWFYELTVALFRCWRHINQRNLRIIAA